MRQKSMSGNDPAERAVRYIRRKTRKQYSAEEKISKALPARAMSALGQMQTLAFNHW